MKKLFTLITLLVLTTSCKNEKFKSTDGEEKEISTLIGLKVFDIIYNQSEATPETLTGTNNKRWVVYLNDINVTLETNKSTDIVQKATLGKNPKSSVWEN